MKTPIEKVQHLISPVSEPGLMTTAEAIELHEELIEWLHENLGGLREDLKVLNSLVD